MATGKHSLVDEDEQLAREYDSWELTASQNGKYIWDWRFIWSWIYMHGGGNVYARGDIYYPKPIAFSMDFSHPISEYELKPSSSKYERTEERTEISIREEAW
ncbi:unnamed protein product [Arabis nemorensis]|uniref:Uncharacterized protein n=1 Tax=Arabis nemorensis TaxID=586526 RepID=A0A565ATE4_9BRAS|nr:unnamed protein product [Arabis nemorensis]